MRRLLLGPLAVLVPALALIVTPLTHAADLPYAGTWKVTLLDGPSEISLWLIKIDKDARKVEVVASHPGWKDTRIGDIKADDKALRWSFQSPRGTFNLIAYPDSTRRDRGKGMRGSLRLQLSRFVRVRLVATDDKDIDPRTAIKPMAGARDFEAAVGGAKKDVKDRIAELKDVLKDHEGQPITYLASQVLMGDLIRARAPATAFEVPTKVYIEQAKAYGHEMTVGAHLAIGQSLLGYDKTQEKALAQLKKASGLLQEKDPRGLQLVVLITLIQALEKNKKDDEVKPVVAQISKTAAAALADSKLPAARVGAARQIALLLLDAPNKDVSAIGVEYSRKAAELAKNEPPPRQLPLYLALVQGLEKNKKTTEASNLIEKIGTAAEATLAATKEPAAKLDATKAIAQLLLGSPNQGVADVGLQYARKAVEMIKDETKPWVKSPGRRLEAYKLLQAALVARKKPEEAKKLAQRIETLEDEYDLEYARESIPFKVAKFAGRKGKSNRAVLVELFTGATCPPCIAADIGFDAALQRYSSKEVVFLQYHLHIPRPDTLTNAECEVRSEFYTVQSTPSMFVDGEALKDVGGFRDDARESYDRLCEQATKNLESAAEASLDLKVTRQGDRIDVSAGVSGLKEAGGKLKLRFVLVEDVVRYIGSNQQRLHHHVVRDFPGGVAGFKLDQKTAKHKASIDLSALRKKLNQYLDDYTKENPTSRFPNPARPLALKKLKVVAFVQDDGSKKVYQAVQVDVPEAGDGKEGKEK